MFVTWMRIWMLGYRIIGNYSYYLEVKFPSHHAAYLGQY
jgi:hypothetical protein